MKTNELENIYTLYSTQVYLYARSLSKDHHLAEELTSDTFFKALMSLRSDTPNIKYWLLHVCRNIYIDSCRKKHYIELPLNEELVTYDNNPLEKILLNESNRKLYEAIEKMSVNEREILTLFYFLGISINQISAFTGRSPGSIKTALSRARVKLKKYLEEEEN